MISTIFWKTTNTWAGLTSPSWGNCFSSEETCQSETFEFKFYLLALPSCVTGQFPYLVKPQFLCWKSIGGGGGGIDILYQGFNFERFHMTSLEEKDPTQLIKLKTYITIFACSSDIYYRLPDN